MGEKLLSAAAVKGLLRERVNGRPLHAVAGELGVSLSYLHGVLAGTKKLGEKIPAAFGLRPVVLYEWDRGAKIIPPEPPAIKSVYAGTVRRLEESGSKPILLSFPSKFQAREACRNLRAHLRKRGKLLSTKDVSLDGCTRLMWLVDAKEGK